MKSPIILFVLLALPMFLFSQVEKSNDQHLSLGIGYHTGPFKDLTYSPLLYATKSLSVDFSYQKTTANGNQWYVNLDVTPGSIQTDVSQSFTADRYFGNIEIGYLAKVNQQMEKGNLWIGGQYHTYADLLFYNNLSAISFFLMHGFDVTGKWAYRFNTKTTYQTQLSLPIVALLVRPSFTGWNNDIIDEPDNYFKIATNGKVTSLNEFFSFTWKNKLTQQLNDKIGLSFQYHLSFHQTNQIDTAKNLNHQFFVGASLNF